MIKIYGAVVQWTAHLTFNQTIGVQFSVALFQLCQKPIGGAPQRVLIKDGFTIEELMASADLQQIFTNEDTILGKYGTVRLVTERGSNPLSGNILLRWCSGLTLHVFSLTIRGSNPLRSIFH